MRKKFDCLIKKKFRKKNLIQILLIFLLVSVLLISYAKRESKFNLYDDFLFFKFFNQIQNSENQSTEKINKYFFSVEYKNTTFQTASLLNTVNEKTLVNRKIAPGCSGEFQIIMVSNYKISYRIKFENMNQKPENLKFKIKDSNNDSNSLNELEKNLVGKLEAKKEKEISLQWKWEYEIGNIENMKDTADGKNISNYNFKIYVIGEGGEENV